jgi:hypothetical protein
MDNILIKIIKINNIFQKKEMGEDIDIEVSH